MLTPALSTSSLSSYEVIIHENNIITKYGMLLSNQSCHNNIVILKIPLQWIAPFAYGVMVRHKIKNA